MEQKRFSFGMLMCAVMTASVVSWLAPQEANAFTRPVFSPGDSKLFLLMQGLSGGQMDPDPRKLYDLIAVAPTQVPGGGDGKGVKTADGAFTLSCVARAALPEDVMCTIVTKASPRTRLSSRDQLAEFIVTDNEAAILHQKLAGVGVDKPFVFDSADGWVHIESTPERFYYRFKK